jgi:hypothetical protein
MSEPVKIMIVMDDGFIGGIYTAGVPVDYVIVNYGVDTAAQVDRKEARMVDGVPAFVDGGKAFVDGPSTLAAFEAWER